MTGTIADFTSTLKQLDAVKAPGVSGSRIRKLVEFVNRNPAEYPEVIKALSGYIETSPAANKLGVMYVVDAIVREYQEEAKKAGNSGPAQEAFQASRKALPSWMSNLSIRKQSVDQFDKMRKVLDIWQRADTVEAATIEEWQREFFAEPYSTTPPGSPPHLWAGLPEDEPEVKPATKKTETPNAEALFGMLQTLAKSKPAESKPAESKSAASPSPILSSANTTVSSASSSSSTASSSNDPSALLQQLISQSKPAASAAASMANDRTASPYAEADPRSAAFGGAVPHLPRGRDPTNKTATFDRNRSRSPARQESPEVAQPRTRAGDATRNLSYEEDLKPDRIKVFSRTLYVGAIPDRYTESDLRDVLEKVAPVQSIILNRERHHAFVKLKSRKEAEIVRETFERQNREGSSVLRIKWGVGYGPRDSFDYYRGVSIVPLMRLTDADKKWATSAEYGGTGGLALEAGMSMEEPDIEVGAGNLGSKNMQRQKMMQAQQQQQQMMMMGGMPGAMGMMPGAVPGAMPGAIPGAIPGAVPGAMRGTMPGMFPMMPGFPMMPPVANGVPNGAAPGGPVQPEMSQFFAQMQQMQMLQQMQQQQQPHQK